MQDRYDTDDSDDTEASEDSAADAGDSYEDIHLKSNNNEVFMLLTGEQDLVKFLHWAMQLLYPHAQHVGPGGADFYHPGMFIWKKLNLSGHLEPPLIVDEPRYILVRREQNSKDDYKLGGELGSNNT